MNIGPVYVYQFINSNYKKWEIRTLTGQLVCVVYGRKISPLAANNIQLPYFVRVS